MTERDRALRDAGTAFERALEDREALKNLTERERALFEAGFDAAKNQLQRIVQGIAGSSSLSVNGEAVRAIPGSLREPHIRRIEGFGGEVHESLEWDPEAARHVGAAVRRANRMSESVS